MTKFIRNSNVVEFSCKIKVKVLAEGKLKYSKTCLNRPLKKKTRIGFQDQLSLNAGQKYCRKHSAILSTFIKLPFVIKIFVLSIFSGRIDLRSLLMIILSKQMKFTINCLLKDI